MHGVRDILPGSDLGVVPDPWNIGIPSCWGLMRVASVMRRVPGMEAR